MIYYRKITITNAQILQLYTTPVLIQEALGAGVLIVPLQITLEAVDVVTPYSVNLNTLLKYRNGDIHFFNENQILKSTVSRKIPFEIFGDASNVDQTVMVFNDDLILTMYTGNPINGNFNLIFHLWFTKT
jgi:hypothetical protein